MTSIRRLVPGCAAVALVFAAACSGSYQPPSHTYTGSPEYVAVGVSVWGNGQVSAVAIGNAAPVVAPEPTPEVILKQKQLDAIF
jgi:hypothetical protein